MQAGANVQMNRDGVLARLADAPRVAPFQPWALGALSASPAAASCRRSRLLELQERRARVRQFQTPYGVQFVEDPARQRIFVLVGGGNRNYRIIYMDGRDQQGQVQGDDDNPLYYGRAVAHWEGDTLVVATTGFNEDFWFTNGGLPHTDQLSLVERFSRPDYDTLALRGHRRRSGRVHAALVERLGAALGRRRGVAGVFLSGQPLVERQRSPQFDSEDCNMNIRTLAASIVAGMLLSRRRRSRTIRSRPNSMRRSPSS